ncbi:hypothetical protein DLM85_02065 [Hymenobacter edaphi]|uniref:Uncharacterized protein n=1 Tax=Hymenobacter edaphi TaxID=2211146 RepID=A0A328BRE7_9BACT|nr:hypothetical protein DLM85_02065 [Hymenobacter edaphi]
MTSCLAAHKAPGSADTALQMDLSGRQLKIWSLNSAQQTRIVRQALSGDTLLIWYKTGAFTSPGNTVQLAPAVRFIKCAGHVYRLAGAGDALRLEKL